MASSSSSAPPCSAADVDAVLISRTQRGGRRQRQAARIELQSRLSADADFVKSFDSQLAVHLLTEWAWGQMSAPSVQKYAHKAF